MQTLLRQVDAVAVASAAGPTAAVKRDEKSDDDDDNDAEVAVSWDVNTSLLRYGLASVALAAFSCDIDDPDTQDILPMTPEEYLANMDSSVMEHVRKQIFAPWRKYLWFLYPKGREAHRAAKRLVAFHETVLALYTTTTATSNNNNNATDTRTGCPAAAHTATAVRSTTTTKGVEECAAGTQQELDPSIMGHLMRCPYASEKERVADVGLFMFAGHDTTAYTVSWCLYCIAKWAPSDILREMQAEIDAWFEKTAPVSSSSSSVSANSADGVDNDDDDDDREQRYLEPRGTPPTKEDVPALERCIKETMRLFPVATGTSRIMGRDLKTRDGVIPKGALVVAALGVQRGTGLQNPDEYRPERWGEGSSELDILKSMPSTFGEGKRRCLGRGLGELVVRTALCELLARFEFKVHTEPTPAQFLTLKPIGLKLTVTTRRMRRQRRHQHH